jgi:Copper binding proteins, plastocyanin/azurin family
VTRVPVGTTVSFVNTSPFSHLVSGANGAWGSREVEVQPGSTISYRFDEPGIYPYACSLHPGMAGAIVGGDIEPAALTDRPTDADGASETVGIAPEGLVTAGAGILGLLLVGGAGVWFATRRRRG